MKKTILERIQNIYEIAERGGLYWKEISLEERNKEEERCKKILNRFNNISKNYQIQWISDDKIIEHRKHRAYRETSFVDIFLVNINTDTKELIYTESYSC